MREEKKWNLSNFRPFYRTTQIIIIPDNQTFMSFDYVSPPAPAPTIIFGPVFDFSFLTRVLELQKTIVSLQAQLPDKNRTISLPDICLKPLEPANKNCTVFSILQYYQNSLDNLKTRKSDDFGFNQTVADYTTHFLTCSQAPTTTNDSLGLSCFGDFGAPVNPYMILGNYSGATYSNATALVITIVIENSNDPEKVQIGSLHASMFFLFKCTFSSS